MPCNSEKGQDRPYGLSFSNREAGSESHVNPMIKPSSPEAFGTFQNHLPEPSGSKARTKSSETIEAEKIQVRRSEKAKKQKKKKIAFFSFFFFKICFAFSPCFFLFCFVFVGIYFIFFYVESLKKGLLFCFSLFLS